ncbi:MAG TPA: ATP-binding protein, partial [Hyphomicrobiaceae bacterium]|nr:ATP-binding protein [Hyphomicrobiaceae bacterium]
SAAERLCAAFEHSITWEDDIWHADPVDVEEVHRKARRKFTDLLDAVTSDGGAGHARMLLFHGQSGAGKTHLIRALRTSSHRAGKAYFAYAQMTPDVASYADYYLRRIINSLEKPYDPDRGGESALQRLTNKLVADSAVLPVEDLNELREAQLDEATLARFVLQLADDIVSSPRFAGEELDVNIVRALLYLQRSDPRIDQRVRQYLYGRPLNDLSQQAVAALDPNSGEGRAFEIIEALGKLAWVVDGASLVFAIDQVEDLRFFPDAEERFQKAVRDLIQIANRVPTSIIIISCLGDFYDQARGVLAQSYIDRIEKSGPVALLESRTPDEARRIIGKRLELEASRGNGAAIPDPTLFFGPNFFEEFGGLSTRRLLEHAQSRIRAKMSGEEGADIEPEMTGLPASDPGAGFISTLARVLGFGTGDPLADSAPAPGIDFREFWERFQSGSEAEMPSDDHILADVLAGALQLAREECGDGVKVSINKLSVGDDLPAFDLLVTHASGLTQDARVFICNRSTQGGGLKRQLDRVLSVMDGKTCFMLRASDFPPNRKNQTAQAFRKYRDAGGQSLMVPIPEWERMMTVREFHRQHRNDPGFGGWFSEARLLSSMLPVVRLMRLEHMRGTGRKEPARAFLQDDRMGHAAGHGGAAPELPAGRAAATYINGSDFTPLPGTSAASPLADWTGWGGGGFAPGTEDKTPDDEDLPLSVILDENGSNTSSILAGRELGAR